MKKRILSALLTLGMVLTMLPVSVFATEPGDGSGTTSYGANLSDEAVGVPTGVTVGVYGTSKDAELVSGVNIVKEGATNTKYEIGDGQAVMISGQERLEDDPIVFENCTFNLSGGTVKISGGQDGISYNNGEVVTKLWIGGNVQFNNCKFVTAEGASKSSSAGYDAAIYFFGGNIELNNCELSAEGYNGQFLGLYGSTGAVTFNHSDISTVGTKNGWSYAMYGGSVLKLNQSTMTATGMSTDSGNINAFYSGDNRTGYDAIYFTDSIVDFSDNKAGGFAINNVNIHVNNSQVTVNNNLGNACNSGYWIVKNSDFTMNGNRGGHALSCIGFEMTGSDVEILHNGYAGVYIQSRDSSFTKCEVDLRCNGEKLLSYTAGDLWLNGHTLTVSGDCSSDAQEGSAWLGGVGRKGAVTTTGSSVVAYDLNSNAVDNLKSKTEPVLTNANIALNGENDKHTLFLNRFMKSDYARGNAENTASSNDADLFKDDNVRVQSDMIGGDVAKIGTLTTAQLSHHKYNWENGERVSNATLTSYGVIRYACTDVCGEYAENASEHPNSFDCEGTYVYAPLVGVSYDANAGDDNVTNMPVQDDDLAYGSVPTTTTPVRESGSSEWAWEFTGWYLDPECTQPLTSAGLTKNWTILYAGWRQTNLPQFETPTVDKTATDLDENDQTDVTLTVGATEEKENVAVMFLLDKSTSQGMRDEAAEMLDELATKSNTNILYDVVIFSGTATATDWQDIQDTDTLEDVKGNFVNGATTSGTNMSAGIQKALTELETLPEEYETKYLITLSDGITYVWSEADDGNVYCVPVQGLGANGQVENTAQNGADTWSMMYEYGTSLEDVYGSVGNFLSAIPAKIQATRDGDHVKDYYASDSLSDPITTHIYDDEATAGVAAQYACGPDFAMYYAVTGYQQLASQFTNTYAFAVPELDGSGNDNTSNWSNYPWGKEIMEYCQSISTNASWDRNVSNADAAEIFEGIKNQILYAIQSGTVTDVIGDDFDLAGLDEIYKVTRDTFLLTVGGETVSAAEVDSTTNTVYFGTSVDGVYPYAVTYYREGQGGDAREQFVWDINVPVENSRALKLTYTLDLVNKEAASGTHTVPTNEEAYLEYETSVGQPGDVYFPVPEVSYEVPYEDALVISKTVHGTNDTGILDQKFEFTVALSAEGEYTYRFLEGKGEEGTISSGDSVYLTSGDSIAIEGLPEGTTYTVTETSVEGFTASVDKTDGAASLAVLFNEEGLSATGVIGASGPSVVHFINTYTGEGPGTVSITPADITIYTGGDGYDSVVNGSGNEIGTTNNGLPTPGFYIELPHEVDQALKEAVGAPLDRPLDLSKYLTFTYDDGQGNTRTWHLERYDNKEGNDSMAYNRYIYRILPAEVNGEEIPIRLQFTDDDETFMTSDDFAVSLDELYHEYDMTIYAGDLNQKLVKAVLTVNDAETEYDATVESGELTVRGVTDNGTHTTDVVTEAPTNVTSVTAQVGENAKFYINGSQLEVIDPSDVKLLVDSLVPDQNNTLVNSALDEFVAIPNDYDYEARYLDLVDTSNGNAYVTTDDAVVVYWAYPEGTDENTEFHLVHYVGLDRNDNNDLTSGTYTMEYYSEENGNLKTTEQGIRFTVNSFSPFTLFWEDDSNNGGGGGSSGGGGGSKPELNKEDHIAYVSGYPDGTVQPEGYITREEVATIFFRLLTDESRADFITDYNPYPDVASDRWSYYAITTMTNGNLMLGRTGGVFDPGANITRAEFAVVAAQFSNAQYSGPDKFTDISDHWARDYINRAANEGWIAGYPDGTFGPDRFITRAEVMALVNEVLERAPDADYMLDNMTVWPDNPKSAWYYEDVQEATNSHSYVWRNTQHTSEDWEDFISMRTFNELVRDAFNAAN